MTSNRPDRINVNPVSFRSFIEWHDYSINLGYYPKLDVYRKDTFIALDKYDQTMGVFIMGSQYYEGFVFLSAEDKNKFLTV